MQFRFPSFFMWLSVVAILSGCMSTVDIKPQTTATQTTHAIFNSDHATGNGDTPSITNGYICTAVHANASGSEKRVRFYGRNHPGRNESSTWT